jgi:hypothetical protein
MNISFNPNVTQTSFQNSSGGTQKSATTEDSVFSNRKTKDKDEKPKSPQELRQEKTAKLNEYKKAILESRKNTWKMDFGLGS